MAHKIQYGAMGESGYEMFDSEREYEEYVVSAERQPEDRWSNGRLEHLTFYVDAATGIMTADVEKFERWVKSRA